MDHAFPEHDFHPSPAYAVPYRARVDRGRALAARSTVVICALARDIGAGGVARLRGAVRALGGLFAGHTAVVVENDSVDATRPALEAWDDEDPALVLSCLTLGRPRWPPVRSGDRGTQMAEYRNRYRDLAVGGPAADYVVVLDSDLAGYSTEGLLSSLGADDWDMMGASGLRVVRGRVVQYDVWAWRDVGHPEAHDARVINPRVYNRGHPPVRVLSCFGGLAVYKGAAFAAGRYAGGDCEHVPFHRAMAAAGYPRAFCNPGMVAVYPP